MSQLKRFFLSPALVLCLSLSISTVAFGDGYGDDRAAIINLQGRYLLAMDFQDAEAYASVFTEDGILDWAGGQIIGKQAIYEFMASGVYNPAANARPVIDSDGDGENWIAASRHFITNQVVDVSGDTAKVITYWIQVNNNDDRRATTLGMFGHYEDELIKADGNWLFTRRAIYNEGLSNRHKAGTENPSPN